MVSSCVWDHSRDRTAALDVPVVDDAGRVFAAGHVSHLVAAVNLLSSSEVELMCDVGAADHVDLSGASLIVDATPWDLGRVALSRVHSLTWRPRGLRLGNM